MRDWARSRKDINFSPFPGEVSLFLPVAKVLLRIRASALLAPDPTVLQ